MAQLKLPIGIENFKKIRTEGYYYVDKTDVIRQILEEDVYKRQSMFRSQELML